MNEDNVAVAVRGILDANGFSVFQNVMGRRSVSHLISSRRRCGIYVLHFTDNWFYVGQSIDMVKRFAQHCTVHGDIKEIAFRTCARRDLDRIEQAIIKEVEGVGAHLRNRLIVSLPTLASDFDAVMTRADQERWLSDTEFDDLEGPRIFDAELIARTESRMALLRNQSSTADILPALGHALLNVVPALFRSELSFWVMSVLPYGLNSDISLRLNIGFQSLLDAGYDQEIGKPHISWWIPRETAQLMTGLELEKGKDLRLRSGRRTIGECIPSNLTHGGPDQVLVRFFEPDEAIALIDDERVLTALRRFSMGLVRKGTCPMSRSHHPAAVDDAIDAACASYVDA